MSMFKGGGMAGSTAGRDPRKNPFRSQKIVDVSVDDLSTVTEALTDHFRSQGFETEGVQSKIGGWEVSIHKGGLFKAVVGLKIALKIEIIPQERSTLVSASAGVFGQQTIPTAITLLVAWPVALTQVWGLIKQARLDDEAISVVETNLIRAAQTGNAVPTASAIHTAAPKTVLSTRTGPPNARANEGFCFHCGQRLELAAQFCPSCGTPRAR